MNDLKPCPFCGENEQEMFETVYEDYCIRCGYCGARGGECGRKEQAKIEWNKRV